MVPRDVQTESPKNHFKLTRVGVTGVKKPIIIKRDEKDIYLSATLMFLWTFRPRKKAPTCPEMWRS